MSKEIEGKVIVITGASSGLGEAAARRLSAEGAAVVLGARRVERIESLAAEIKGSGGKALAVATDVTKVDQVKALVDAAVKAYGRVDVMINNAGLMPHSPLERLKIDDWDRTIDVNIKGVLYGIAAALPYMKEQKSGHFINVSSVAGHKVGPNGAVYSATKHAVRVLSEGLRQEVKPYNIRTTVTDVLSRINTISPGITMTPLAKDELSGPRGEGYRRMIEGSAAGRAGTPDEVANGAALLMGPDGGLITGSDILMDGGVTAAYWYGDLSEVRAHEK